MGQQETLMMPELFSKLIARDCLSKADLYQTGDGFCAAAISVSQILSKKGIETFPNDQDQQRRCDCFFDDWFLFSVSEATRCKYGLFKMREQEDDKEKGLIADGDTPGVTISFVPFFEDILLRCLDDPTYENRKALGHEINRVVVYGGQSHEPVMKAYFIRPDAQAPYLIAQLYVKRLAAFAKDCVLEVPKHYLYIHKKIESNKASHKERRIPDFISANNRAAGYTVCDHKKIYLRDPQKLTPYEAFAILATHTANIGYHSFAAEVRYHACFLTQWAKIPLPILGRSIYSSAIRADMTIDDTEFEGPAPFYRMNSRWIRLQKQHHPDQLDVALLR